jgi:primosomal protein N' (replication factor Y)
MTDKPLWKIAVDCPLPEALTYLQGEDMPLLQRGQLVNVPLGTRVTKGMVLGPSTATLNPEIKLKPVRSLDEEYPNLPEHFIKWLEWLANYYMHPIGQVVQLAYPPLEKKKSCESLSGRQSFRKWRVKLLRL